MKNKEVMRRLGILAVAVSVTTATLTSNVATMTVYAANIEEGETVETNNTTIDSNYGTITTNNGTVGWNENGGTITTNEDTVEKNNTYGTIATNNGTVGINYGTITTNEDTVTKNSNNGTITTNNGTVVENYQTIITNNDTVNKNHTAGTIATNNGTVDVNYGTIDKNLGTVTNNYGTVNNTYIGYDGGGSVSKTAALQTFFEVLNAISGTGITFNEGNVAKEVNNKYYGSGDISFTISSDKKILDIVCAEKEGGSNFTITHNEDGTWTVTGNLGCPIKITGTFEQVIAVVNEVNKEDTAEQISAEYVKSVETLIAIEESLPVMTFASEAAVNAIPAEAKTGNDLTYNISSVTTIPGFVAAVNKIANASPVSVMSVYSSEPMALNAAAISAITNTGKTFVYTFTYKGHIYKVTIPAGAKINTNGQYFMGPLAIGAQLGTTQIVK